jgi:hypothetical protein
MDPEAQNLTKFCDEVHSDSCIFLLQTSIQLYNASNCQRAGNILIDGAFNINV